MREEPPPPPAGVWVHPDVTVRRSAIHGGGLFAARGLAAGTTVVRLGGHLVSGAELARLLAGPRWVDTITVAEDRHLVLPPATTAHWGNHSCDPTLWHDGPYALAARRDVGAGEELTVDYGTHSGDPAFRMPCACGAPTCRSQVTGEDWRRPDLHARYRGHWAPVLRARILASA
jgi:hypothetical protein